MIKPLRTRCTIGIAALVATMLFAAAHAQETELPSASGPVLVTSLGQSLDAFQVQLMLARTDVVFDYEPLAGVDMLEGKNTVFLVVGASVKGFGEAGISIQDELVRTQAFIDRARELDLFVVVLHPGGTERRDGLTNQLIALAAPNADLLMIRTDSDEDGVFSDIAAQNEIQMVTFGNVLNLTGTFRTLFRP